MAESYAPPTNPGSEHASIGGSEDEQEEQAFVPPRLQSVQPAYAVGPAEYGEYSASAAPQLVQPSEVYREPGGYPGMDGYGAASSTIFQSPAPLQHPPPMLAPNDDEMAAMVSTIESFSRIPAICAAVGPVITLLISSAMGGTAWKTGVLSGDFVSVGLATVTLFGTGPDPPDGTRGVPQPLAVLCSDHAQASACRLHSVGMLMRVLLSFALLAAIASTVCATVLVLLDANRLAPLRAQLGHSGVHALPRIASSCWATTTVLLGVSALLYAALSPFRYRETTLVLDASYGLVRLALLLSALAGLVHTRYLRHVRPMVVSATFSAAAERGAMAERPLEVELGLELVRACRLLLERSRPLSAMLCAQLVLQLLALVHAPQWSALLTFAGQRPRLLLPARTPERWLRRLPARLEARSPSAAAPFTCCCSLRRTRCQVRARLRTLITTPRASSSPRPPSPRRMTCSTW